MIKCLAIDDEPLALRQLAAYIKKIPYLQLVGECQSALDAKAIMENEAVDAIFIDINMPDLNGMDFVRSLAAPPIVVFTTAYSEYAVDGYKVDAVDYLLKPFGLNEFQRAATKVRRHFLSPDGANTHHLSPDTRLPSPHEDDALYMKTDYKVVRVNLAEINYVEGMSEYLKIHFTNRKPIVVLLTMKKLEERLPDHFMRIHRSYIVNLNNIREVVKNHVVLNDDTQIPVGELYRDAFNDYLNRKFLGK